MATAPRKMHYSYADYVALETSSPLRHEYFDGEIYAMACGTPDHAALALNVLALIRNRLSAGCRGFTSDLRIRIPATGLATYPDGAVVCGPTQRHAEDPQAVTNPILLVEVTSPSSEDYDRGEKLRQYQTLSSLREVVILSHVKPRITVHRRDEGGRWVAADFTSGQSFDVAVMGARLAVDEVYQGGLEDVSRSLR